MTSTDAQTPDNEASKPTSSDATPDAQPSTSAAPGPRPEPPEASMVAPPASRPPKKSGGVLRIAAVVLIVLAAAFVGAAISRYVLPDPRTGVSGSGAQQLQKEVADLSARLESLDFTALRERVAALEDSGGAESDLTARLTAVEQAAGELSASIAELRERPALTLPDGVSLSQESIDNLNAAASGLKSQVEEMASKLDVAESSMRGANAALNNRITALEQKVPANIADQLANIPSNTDIADLDKRLAALESSTTALDAKRAAAAIALANLARAAGSGAPFGPELAAVRFLDVDPALVNPLAGYADGGVKTASVLVAEYDQTARDALRAARGATGDWWSRLWANLTGLFLVRRTGPMAGGSAEAILSRAGDAANKGDLRTAAAELSKLSGPAAAAMDEWRQAAEARTDLDRLITSLTATLIATLNGQSPQ